MLRIREIIAADRATYYDFGANILQPVWPRLCIALAGSGALSLILNVDLKDFLNGVIPVQAILIGFSFSVMFFLVNGQKESTDAVPIEQKIMRERLNRLSRELFDNLSYFNLAAIGCLSAALLLLLPHPYLLLRSGINHLSPDAAMSVKSTYDILLYGGTSLVRWVLLFLLFESGFSFARTVGR